MCGRNFRVGMYFPVKKIKVKCFFATVLSRISEGVVTQFCHQMECTPKRALHITEKIK